MCRDVVAKKERLGIERGVQKNALRLGGGNEMLFSLFEFFDIYRKTAPLNALCWAMRR